jgi:hypothetical protein
MKGWKVSSRASELLIGADSAAEAIEIFDEISAADVPKKISKAAAAEYRKECEVTEVKLVGEFALKDK